jgi:peptidyl-tRNA hydrolase, PTH1 family
VLRPCLKTLGSADEPVRTATVWATLETEELGRIPVDIIVGVGNPGRRYAYTRHNLGFDVVDGLASRYEISMQRLMSEAICGQGKIGSHTVLLVKPQTYMNASGRAVAPLARKYMGAGDCLVVIHDDIDLPLGQIKIKRQGGDAGHLGVRSIIACLGHGEFLRIRMGIGRPVCKAHIVDYVLSAFTPMERQAREEMIAQAVLCVDTLLRSAP